MDPDQTRRKTHYLVLLKGLNNVFCVYTEVMAQDDTLEANLGASRGRTPFSFSFCLSLSEGFSDITEILLTET